MTDLPTLKDLNWIETFDDNDWSQSKELTKEVVEELRETRMINGREPLLSLADLRNAAIQWARQLYKCNYNSCQHNICEDKHLIVSFPGIVTDVDGEDAWSFTNTECWATLVWIKKFFNLTDEDIK